MAVADALFFDAAYPVLALLAVFVVGAAVPLLAGFGERTRLKNSLETHIAPAAMAQITRAPELLKLAGEARSISFLACGIRRYAQLSESFADEPEALRRMTRRMLTALSDAALKYKGAIDRLSPSGLTRVLQRAPRRSPITPCMPANARWR